MSKSVFAVSISPAGIPRSSKEWKITTHFAVALSEAGAISMAQKETPGHVHSVNRLGSEADLEPKPDVELEINGEKFKYAQPGLLASAPAGTKVLR